ncbi:MAG: hypothetical protein H7246_09305 [Phycisphaerae bacterium]|nr:hypothetical protein [Saprospiraceae bacterium]
MKDKKKEKNKPALTFEEAMRKIISIPKKEVEDAIKVGKKKPRGKFVEKR